MMTLACSPPKTASSLMHRFQPQDLVDLIWTHSSDGLIMFEWVEGRQDLKVLKLNSVASDLTSGSLQPEAFLCEALPVHLDYNEDVGMPLIAYYKGIIDSGQERQSIFRVDGSIVGGYWSNSAVPAVHNGDRFLFMTFRNVSSIMEEKQQEATRRRTAERIALTDELTGICNRRAFNEQIEEWCGSGHAFTMAAIDLNGFKQANDTFGHAVGDIILQHVARRIKGACRGCDRPFRIGGDEFVVLFCDGNDCESFPCDQIGERLHSAIHQPIDASQIAGQYSPSASIGIVQHEQGRSPDDLMAAADEQMYIAKGKGRKYSILSGWRNALFVLAKELSKEFEKQEFLQLYYQKIVDISQDVPWEDMPVVSYEALIRWPREGGAVSPEAILAAVKRCGLSEQFCLWVIFQAQLQWQRWGCPDVTIAVNLYPSDLQFNSVYQALQGTQGLAIEITEHEMLESDEVLRRIDNLREIGIRVYIDDFGQKYSALARLQELNADRVKLDRALTINPLLAKGANCLLGDTLGYPTVAEGVESEEVLQWLRSIGVPYAQGYLWGLPSPGGSVVF